MTSVLRSVIESLSGPERISKRSFIQRENEEIIIEEVPMKAFNPMRRVEVSYESKN
jgi:hypothetical protein